MISASRAAYSRFSKSCKKFWATPGVEPGCARMAVSGPPRTFESIFRPREKAEIVRSPSRKGNLMRRIRISNKISDQYTTDTFKRPQKVCFGTKTKFSRCATTLIGFPVIHNLLLDTEIDSVVSFIFSPPVSIFVKIDFYATKPIPSFSAWSI